MNNDRLVVYSLLVNQGALEDVEKLPLSMPQELLRQLATTSKERLTDINVEIVSRLMLTMINPKGFGLNFDIDSNAGKRLIQSKKHLTK